LSYIGSDTTGVSGYVNLSRSPSSMKTWKQSRTAFRSILVGWLRWEKPAAKQK